MKLGLLYAAVCTFALLGSGCATEATDSDEQQSGNTTDPNTCENGQSPCYCIDIEESSDCPVGYRCLVADSPLPPYQGICFEVCASNTDPNCLPPPCDENTDPSCMPPGNGGNNTGCNAGNCP